MGKNKNKNGYVLKKKKRDMWDGEKEKGHMWGRRKVWAYIGEEEEYVGNRKMKKRWYMWG